MQIMARFLSAEEATCRHYESTAGSSPDSVLTMRTSAVLIQTPAIDFDTFLGLSQEALGYSPSEGVDASPVDRSNAERFLACLASLRSRKSSAVTGLLTHVSFSVLAAAGERDMLDILQAVSGMPFVVADTVVRGVQLAVITGTLAQWKNAVASGSAHDSQVDVRAFFNVVLGLFEAAGMNVWKDFENYPLHDHTFYLEDKRK